MQTISHSITIIIVCWKWTLYTWIKIDVLEYSLCDSRVWISRCCHAAVQTDVMGRDSLQVQNWSFRMVQNAVAGVTHPVQPLQVGSNPNHVRYDIITSRKATPKFCVGRGQHLVASSASTLRPVMVSPVHSSCVVRPVLEVVCVLVNHLNIIVRIIADDSFIWRRIYPAITLVVIYSRLWIARHETQYCGDCCWKTFQYFICHCVVETIVPLLHNLLP